MEEMTEAQVNSLVVLLVHYSFMLGSKVPGVFLFPRMQTFNQQPERNQQDEQYQQNSNNVALDARAVAHLFGHPLDVDRFRIVLVNAGHRLDVRDHQGGVLDYVEEVQVPAAAERVRAHVEGFQ